MTLLNKCPKARHEARCYFRRCLAVMLCLVLLSGFTFRVAPRAKAVAGEEILTVTTVAGGSASIGLGPILGVALLAAVGFTFVPGYFEHDQNKVHASVGYSWGRSCWDYLYDLGGDIGDWCMDLMSKQKAKGGLQPGETITVPAEVAELVRAWAVDNFNFTDGICTYEDYALQNGEGNYFVLSDVDTAQLDATTSKRTLKCNLRQMGSLVKFHVGDFSASYEIRDYITNDIYCVSRYTLTEPTTEGGGWSGKVGQFWYLPGFSDDTSVSGGMASMFSAYSSKSDFISAAEKAVASQFRYGVLFRSSSTNRLYCGLYETTTGLVYAGTRDYCDLGAIVPAVAETTMTETPAVDEPITTDKAVTVPATAPITYDADGMAIPLPDVWRGGETLPDDSVDDPSVGAIPWAELKQLLEGLNGKVGALPGEIGGTLTDGLTGAMSGAISDALAGSKVEAQAKAQEQAVEDALTAPDSLGAVFISKFPFCIPWDIVQVFKLVAAPPVTPRWEVDFYGPLEGYKGFHAQGDTSFVVDLTEFEFMGQLCRWTSTIGFLYALASGTKRILWTS